MQLMWECSFEQLMKRNAQKGMHACAGVHGPQPVLHTRQPARGQRPKLERGPARHRARQQRAGRLLADSRAPARQGAARVTEN